MVELLVAVVGIVAGINLYSVTIWFVLRVRRGEYLFTYREGVYSALFLLALGAVLAAFPYALPGSIYQRLGGLLLGSLLGGAGATQLWYVNRGRRLRP